MREEAERQEAEAKRKADSLQKAETILSDEAYVKW